MSSVLLTVSHPVNLKVQSERSHPRVSDNAVCASAHQHQRDYGATLQSLSEFRGGRSAAVRTPRFTRRLDLFVLRLVLLSSSFGLITTNNFVRFGGRTSSQQ